MNVLSYLVKFLTSVLFICLFYSLNYSQIEKNHVNLMRQTASECTLFLNKNNEFPIQKPCNVLLIGSGARNTIKGGMGSGDVDSHFFTTCEEGLEKSGFRITTKQWLSEYIKIKENNLKEHMDYIQNMNEKYIGNRPFEMVSFPEVEYKLSFDQSDILPDIAIYVLSRNSGEGMDRRLIKGDVFLTDTEIKDILYLNKNYKKFMLVLNVGGVVDLSPVVSASNILLLSQLGVVTGDILSDIILGKTNPSGKLATTWAGYKDYKFINEFGQFDNTSYIEGVYVGYRYFDSARVKPLYPFGFGKSYTSFDIKKISLNNNRDEISIKVKLKNIGKFPGKEVVQIYISPSQENKDKPYQSLVCFKKSDIIKPNNEIEMILNFKLRDMARYSSKGAYYILDKGNYIIRVGNSSNNTKIYGYIRLEDDIIIEQLTNIVDAPDFKDYVPEKKIEYEKLSDYEKIFLTRDDFDFNEVNYTYTYKVYNKLKKLSDTELVNLCLGDYSEKERDLFNDRRLGMAGTTTKKIEGLKYYINMADGPAGLRLARIYGINSEGIHRLSRDIIISNNYLNLEKKKKISLVKNKTDNIDYSKYSKIGYQYPTAIPIATALAQSFNIEYIERVGRMVGKEMKYYNVHLWLAPAMNIHRNILCGRNFEYFSEDPLVSGKIAAALVRGVQKYKNRGATVKHFAGNNQEFNRLNSNSKMSERALREIYLKGFKIALQESNPKALMTSYNLINGIHPSENELFLIDVLRSEWKYDGLIMTDWSHTGRMHFLASKNPPQFAFEIIKGGNNLIMPGDKSDYNELTLKLNDKLLTRDDLLRCASKVYETILLLNK